MQRLQITQIKKNKNLTHALVESLREQIVSGAMKKGDKFPSSKTIEQQANVSRTVVREAVAQLRAEGLVESRQGVGVFVTNANLKKGGFEITSEEFKSLEDAIQILELRMAVEVEMAGMAAEFRTQQQMDKINDALAKMETNAQLGEDSLENDMLFHQVIAEASGNPYFLRFMEYIGSSMIPNRDIVTRDMSESEEKVFLDNIQDEHRQIANAIQTQSIELAKATAKNHLMNSIKRHRQASSC